MQQLVGAMPGSAALRRGSTAHYREPGDAGQQLPSAQRHRHIMTALRRMVGL